MAYSHCGRGRDKTVLSCRVGGVNMPLDAIRPTFPNISLAERQKHFA